MWSGSQHRVIRVERAPQLEKSARQAEMLRLHSEDRNATLTVPLSMTQHYRLMSSLFCNRFT